MSWICIVCRSITARPEGEPRSSGVQNPTGLPCSVPKPATFRLRDERLSTGRRYISVTLRLKADIECPQSKEMQERTGARTMLATPLMARGRSDWGDRHSPHGGPAVRGQADQTARNLRRPGGDRDRERALVQRTSASATQNCAKPWGSRQQRPRCSASSAARPPTCSRCSTPSSRVQHGFVK